MIEEILPTELLSVPELLLDSGHSAHNPKKTPILLVNG